MDVGRAKGKREEQKCGKILRSIKCYSQSMF